MASGHELTENPLLMISSCLMNAENTQMLEDVHDRSHWRDLTHRLATSQMGGLMALPSCKAGQNAKPLS